jgi:hypothetical protein
MGYFEELHTESFKVYDLIPYEEENLDKQPPQIAKLPLVVKSFKAQVVPKNVGKESIFVINLKHFIESTIIYYEGMKNVYGISKKYSLASTLVDIGAKSFHLTVKMTYFCTEDMKSICFAVYYEKRFSMHYVFRGVKVPL